MTGGRPVDNADKSARAKRGIVRRLEAAWAKVFGPADAYHPEEHYLRGRPGPRAQAKHHHDDGK